MYCPYCGSENLDNARVCTSCGAELTEQKKEEQAPAKAVAAKQPKVSSGTIIKVLAVAVLAIIVIAIIAGLSGGRSGDYVFVEQEVAIFENDDKSTVFVDGKAIKPTISGEASIIRSSIDNKICLIKAEEDDETVYYTLRGKKLEKIEKSEDWSGIVMSSTGEGIAYTIEEDDETTLYLYDVSKKKSTEVESSDSYIKCTALSPDGESLTYVMREKKDEYTAAYFFNGKKSQKLAGKNVSPIGLSDGGKYIYAATINDEFEMTLKLYNKKGESKATIGKGDEDVIFNTDHTQLLYVSKDKVYISVKGKEGVKFFKNDSLYPVVPHDTKAASDGTYPIENFYNQFYYSDGGIYKVKKNEKYVKLASKVAYQFSLSEDGSTLYYQNTSGDVKMVKTSWSEEKAASKAVLIAEDADQFIVTSDCKRVYYMDGDELYSVKGNNGKSKKAIDDDVDDMWLGKGDILYYYMDDAIYATSNGKKGTSVRSDVEDLDVGYLGYLYVTADDTVYITKGSKKPKQIFKYD